MPWLNTTEKEETSVVRSWQESAPMQHHATVNSNNLSGQYSQAAIIKPTEAVQKHTISSKITHSKWSSDTLQNCNQSTFL